ncbi:MAG: hypothetical protein KY468_03520, partial [Armatimonadetes bacterium]|nr:hypothetical protein [Armatimonadota bacterium]
MSVINNLIRKSYRLAFFALFLSGLAVGLAQVGNSGPWPLFHRDPARQGESNTSLTGSSALTGIVTATNPANRWNFPHLINNRLPNQEGIRLPWNLGHIVASPTVGEGMAVGTANNNALYFASFDRFKFEFGPGTATIKNPQFPEDQQFLDYNLNTHGTVWSVNAQQGPNLNALTGDWWWGYRDAQPTFRTFNELNGRPTDPDDPDAPIPGDVDPPDTTPKNASQGIHIRRISDRLSPLMGDNPNVVGLTPEQINAGGRPGTDVRTFRDFQFLRLVSRAIVASYPAPEVHVYPGEAEPIYERRNDRPVGAIRSTPSFHRLPAAISYSARTPRAMPLNTFNTLENPFGSRPEVNVPTNPFSTNSVIVFGSEDGYIYCLDANPANLQVYTWTDPEGVEHTTRVPNLIWRFDSQSLVNPRRGETPIAKEVLSSPLFVDQLPGYAGPVVVIGTGVGYLAVLDAATGRHEKSAPTSYFFSFSQGSTNLRVLFGIKTSPALYPRGGSPLIIFGADDGIVYAWDPNKNLLNDSFVWKFYTGSGKAPPANNDPNLPEDRLLSFNPPVVASPVVLSAAQAGADMILVGATAPKGGSIMDTGKGAVYALNPSTGAELWNFQDWYDRRKADPNDLEGDATAVSSIGAVRATPAFSDNVRTGGGPGAPVRRVAFVRDDNGNLFALYVDTNIQADAVQKDQPRMAWEIPFDLGGEGAYAGVPFPSSPVVTQDGFVYIGSGQGRIRGIDPNHTAPIRLSNTEPSPQSYRQGNPTWQFVTGIVRVSSFNSKTRTQTYEIVSRPIIATPALAPNFLYVATDGGVFAYQSTSGGGGGFTPNPFGGAGGINMPPSQEEQPTGGPADDANNRDRPQAEIVSQADFGTVPTDDFHSRSIRENNQPWTAQRPGRVEWGDTIYVVAWNLDERVSTASLEIQGPSGNVRILVPVSNRGSGDVGRQGYARYGFVLDPYTREIVDPRNPALRIPNPFYRQPLTPGGDGTPTWTVQVTQNSAPDPATGQGGGARTSNPNSTIARFRINNPIDLWAPGTLQSLTQAAPRNIPLNGNRDVPLMGSVTGSHNQKSTSQLFHVGDRSHLWKVTHAPLGTLPPGAEKPRLRVKVAPAELQWMGGGRAVYKPLFESYQMALGPNAPQIQARPNQFSPLFEVLIPQLTDNRTKPLEIAPAPPGMPNLSPDYPNIPPDRFIFEGGDDLERNAIQQDIVLDHQRAQERMTYAVNVPRHQPANRYPLGRGYATINPTNDFAVQIADPSRSNGSLPPNGYQPAFPIDNPYLTRIYADTSRNRTLDVNEAFRAIVARLQVGIDEQMEVAEPTVSVPGSTTAANVPVPPGIAHGFVPYTNYNRENPLAQDPILKL